MERLIGVHLKRLGQLWQPPRAHGDADRGRTVSFLELFHDLVYVALIAAAAHHLAGHMEWSAVGEFGVVFSLVWLAWLNGAAEHDLHGREDVRTRTFTFVQMLLVALLAVYASMGADGRDGFSIVYGAFFIVLGWLWFSAHLRADESHRRVSRRYLVLILLTVAAAFGSAFAPPPAQLWVWGAVALVWVSALFFATRATAGLSGEPVIVSHSLVERFGLFVIIVLGEVVVGVVRGLSESAGDLETIATGMLALGVGFGIWWTYFDLTGRRLPREDRTGLPVWIVLHLPLTMCIAAAGAAMVSVIEHAGDPRAPEVVTWVLGGSVALSLVAIAAIAPTLRDFARYRRIYSVTCVAMVALALASAIPIGLLRPAPLELVAALLGVLTLVWLVTIVQWLKTGEEVEP
ncbi:MAG: low temperature requirement protein A [Chloroflexi bacterium]|nr:low temperature requirement protein A [Chloroflexota bacterium]